MHEPEASALRPEDVSPPPCLTLILHFYHKRSPNFSFTRLASASLIVLMVLIVHSASRYYSYPRASTWALALATPFDRC